MVCEWHGFMTRHDPYIEQVEELTGTLEINDHV